MPDSPNRRRLGSRQPNTRSRLHARKTAKRSSIPARTHVAGVLDALKTRLDVPRDVTPPAPALNLTGNDPRMDSDSASAATPAGSHPAAAEDEIEKIVLSAYEDLCREKYFRTNAVPIFEVRNVVRDRLGQDAAGHGVLDTIILNLRRSGRFRLIAMSLSLDTPREQIDAGIPGLEEVFFYMEKVA